MTSDVWCPSNTHVRVLLNSACSTGRMMDEVSLSLERGAGEGARGRPRVAGKYFYLGDEKLYVRGVTYGPFRPGRDGDHYDTPLVVSWDFALMAGRGVNAVRTYTVPPLWFLDCAERFGLRVLVGTPWEQHVAFLEDRRRAREIEDRVRAGVRACAGHPAVLGYAIGNEIPASLVRWYGGRRVSRYLERLYEAAKEEDPGALVTYVNYPTTEYLELPFLDFASFNVYLESPDQLDAYLARLQNLAGDRPLVLGEVGVDSRTHGELGQARMLSWQLSTAFAAGCAGAFVFAWTDEWHRGGAEIEDWDFGLTCRDRTAKPALTSVRKSYATVPFPVHPGWPRVSVVICSYNGSRTLRETLEAIVRLEYPNYEVIVVDDGSTDATPQIAGEFDVRLIRSRNRGLSHARNLGLAAATGEIVAYLDDDAYPDPHWLTYLAHSFATTTHAGIGGPNIPPPGDGWIAESVANAPGGPTHVLLSDREAEHIPGCNMAFRKRCLDEVGGFDPAFRVAGDDVDLCWRLQERGWTLGFSPAAMVWHHRRNSVRAYWKQQKGYGRAEAQLERKWPEKYNTIGHVAWAGRLYGGSGEGRFSLLRRRIYQGTWGSAPFQSVYHPRPGLLAALPVMPEWYLVILAFAVLGMLGVTWSPLLIASSLAGYAGVALLVHAGVSAAQARYPYASRERPLRFRRWALTTFLHLLQQLARLVGRLSAGLTPWRRRRVEGLRFTWPSMITLWSETWRGTEDWLYALESKLRERGVVVQRGGDFDHWDLEVRSGALGCIRTRLGIEEHGGGKQLLRFRCWPRWSVVRIGLILGLCVLAVMAVVDGALLAGGVLGGLSLLFLLRKVQDFLISASAVADAVESIAEREVEPVAEPLGAGTAAGPVTPADFLGDDHPWVAAPSAALASSPAEAVADPVAPGAARPGVGLSS